MMDVVLLWLSENWVWVVAGFWVAEKIVKMSSWEKDDIIIDIIYGFIKQLVKKGVEKAKV